MPALPDPDRRIVVHEAGHAVAALSLGWSLENISTVPGDAGVVYSPGLVSWLDEGAVALAGCAAEAKFGYPPRLPDGADHDALVLTAALDSGEVTATELAHRAHALLCLRCLVDLAADLPAAGEWGPNEITLWVAGVAAVTTEDHKADSAGVV